MSIFDAIEALFHHETPVSTVAYPETAQDGGTPPIPPNANPQYFVNSIYPNLAPVGVLPEADGPENEWLLATRSDHYVPYVGSNEHGLDINVDPSKIPTNDIDLIKARGHAYGTPVGEPHAVPVPVMIVDTPVLFGVEKKWTTNTFTLVIGAPTIILAKNPGRTRLLINVSGGGPVVLGPSVEQVSGNVGYILSNGQSLALQTNQPVYALTAAGNTVVSVMEEFTIVEGQKRV